jgi:hypothetical protein
VCGPRRLEFDVIGQARAFVLSVSLAFVGSFGGAHLLVRSFGAPAAWPSDTMLVLVLGWGGALR